MQLVKKMANYISTTATNRGKTTHTLIENHLKNEDEKSVGITAVTPLGLFRIIKPYLARIDNIHCLEENPNTQKEIRCCRSK